MPPHSIEWIYKDLEKILKRKSVETPVNFVGVRG
jgi:hypothetical protein